MEPLTLLLLAGGAAAFFLYSRSHKSETSAEVIAGPATNGKAATPAPTVLPQALSPAQRSALYKQLPSMDLIAGPTTTPSSARVEVAKLDLKKNATSGQTRFDAFPILVAANVGGQDRSGPKLSILVTASNEPGGMEVAAVEGADVARSMLLPGSRWFLFLEPAQALTLSKEVGAPAIPANLPKPPSTEQSQGLAGPNASGVDAPSVSDMVMKPIRITANIISAILPKSDANTALADVPGAVGDNARAAAASAATDRMVAWADALNQAGFHKAASQLFEQAYAVGWRPSPADHPELLQLGDVIDENGVDYSVPLSGMDVNFNQASDGSYVTDHGGVNIKQLRDFIAAVQSAPIPAYTDVLHRASASFDAAGFKRVADDLNTLAKSITG